MRNPPSDSSYRYRPSSGSMIGQTVQPVAISSTGGPSNSVSGGFSGASSNNPLGVSSGGSGVSGQAYIIPVVHLGASRASTTGLAGAHSGGPGSPITISPNLLADSPQGASIPAATVYATSGPESINQPAPGNGVLGHQQQPSLTVRGHPNLVGSLSGSSAVSGSPTVTIGPGVQTVPCVSGGVGASGTVGAGSGGSGSGPGSAGGIGSVSLRNTGRLTTSTVNRDQEAEVDALTNILMQSMETKSSIGSASSSGGSKSE